MAKNIVYVLILIAVIVGLDVLLLRHQFWLRLAVNIAVVLVFLVLYWAFLRK